MKPEDLNHGASSDLISEYTSVDFIGHCYQAARGESRETCNLLRLTCSGCVLGVIACQKGSMCFPITNLEPGNAAGRFGRWVQKPQAKLRDLVHKVARSNFYSPQIREAHLSSAGSPSCIDGKES